MSNIIVGPSGEPVKSSEPTRPKKMEERIQAALDLWMKGEKDLAFATALNAIAYQSSGFASMAKITERLEEQIRALTERVNLLPPPTTPPNATL